MTTVWPIIVLGLVATIVLLLPSLLKGTLFPGSERSVQQEPIQNYLKPHPADKFIGHPPYWAYVCVCALLPVMVLLLLLWAAAARELGENCWWIPLVIVLPAAIGAITAWNQRRHGDKDEPLK